MSSYRNSDLPTDAPAAGTVETITQWSGHTMGGRVPAFMGLAQRTGGVYLENPPSVQDALKATGLDFEVRLETVEAVVTESAPGMSETGELVEVQVEKRLAIPRYRATVAHFHDGRDPVAITPWVSPRYTPVQNTDALQWGQNIVDGGAGSLVALGAYGDPVGSKTYAAFDLGDFTVGGKRGGDAHKLYLTVTNAHDGSGGLTARVAPIRLACTNETPIYFGKGTRNPRFTMKHTAGVGGRVAEARQALEMAREYTDTLVDAMGSLLDVQMTENEFIAYTRQVFGVKGQPSDWSKRAATVNQAREDVLTGILASPTCDYGRGTAYGAFQAVAEYADHFSGVRGSDDEKVARRQERLMEGSQDVMRQRAWDLLAV